MISTLISLDFNKAFDSLEWPLIIKVLTTFNFGMSLRKWVTVFYSNIESAVINNGFATVTSMFRECLQENLTYARCFR